MRFEEMFNKNIGVPRVSVAESIAEKMLESRNVTLKECFESFNNIEHRLEHVAYIGGVEYINDSVSTCVNKTWYSLQKINKPILWIGGGLDFDNEYEMLSSLVKTKVRVLICMGANRRKMAAYFSDIVEKVILVDSLREAVAKAADNSEEDDAVLFSPASLSFDAFSDYRERGKMFKKLVKSL